MLSPESQQPNSENFKASIELIHSVLVALGPTGQWPRYDPPTENWTLG